MCGLPPIAISLNGRLVLADIAVSARRGELIAICGPKGAGKSTFVMRIWRTAARYAAA
jgi:ABC-type hemin transport system ATPase subunit